MNSTIIKAISVVGVLAASAAGLAIVMHPAEPTGEVPAQTTNGQAGAVSRVVTASSYSVEMSFKQKVDFPSTGIAFRGKVTDILAPRHVAIPNSRMEYVYTPVVVDISEMYLGELPRDRKMTLRIMGGTADGVQYDLESPPSDEVKNKGVELVVVGVRPVQVPGDGDMVALTPGGLFVVDGDTLVDAHPVNDHQEETKISLREAESILAARKK